MTAATPEERDALAALAAEVAPSIVGLDRDEAQRRITARDDRLTARFASEGQLMTMEYRFGRITATVRDDVVVAAVAG